MYVHLYIYKSASPYPLGYGAGRLEARIKIQDPRNLIPGGWVYPSPTPAEEAPPHYCSLCRQGVYIETN